MSYTGKEKEFIGLLELVGEEGWTKVQSAVEDLRMVSPTHLSTEKVVSLCKRNNDEFPPKTEDNTLALSKDILSAYSQLLNDGVNKFDEGVQVL